jgi:DNA-binding transcriptional LysR family regulator
VIQLNRLEGFYWVARTEGYARAARAFPYPITQPAIHQQVKKLEIDLGVRLFERVGKDRMALTPAGARLYKFVGPYFDGLPAVLRSIKMGDYAGELKIQTAALFLRHLLPAWVKRLHKGHPDIQVHLEETRLPGIAALRHGETDMLVDYIPDPPDDVSTMVVARMSAFIVIPRDHELSGRKRLKLSSLGDETFISYTPGLVAHQLQLEALASHGVRPERVLSASTADAILGFVESGLGYSIVPSIDSSGPKAKGVTAVPLSTPRMEFEVVAAWRRDTPENPLLDAALELAPKP